MFTKIIKALVIVGGRSLDSSSFSLYFSVFARILAMNRYYFYNRKKTIRFKKHAGIPGNSSVVWSKDCLDSDPGPALDHLRDFGR